MKLTNTLSFLKIFLCLTCLINTSTLFGQLELITNGDFQKSNICTEMNAKCAPSAWFLVSNSLPLYNFQNVGIIVFNSSKKNVRQYLQQQLVSPLEKGKTYHFSITVWGHQISVPSIGLMFSENLICKDYDILLDFQPNVDLTPFINSKDFSRSKKIVINYTYKALGGEKFIILGNFQKDAEQKKTNPKKIKPYQNYYLFIDNVILIDNTSSETEQTKQNRQHLNDYQLRHSGCAYIPFEYEIQQDTKDFTSSKDSNSIINEVIVFDNILFETNSYSINKTYKTYIINKLSKINKENVKSIIIEGHTDNVGKEDENLILSQKRANAFKEILLTLDFNPEIISCYGYGESKPKFDNSTEEGRKGNRRIELYIEY